MTLIERNCNDCDGSYLVTKEALVGEFPRVWCPDCDYAVMSEGEREAHKQDLENGGVPA